MSWLVAWFRNGELNAATVCRCERTKNRIANQFNEYAQFYNSHGKDLHTVSVFEDSLLLTLARVHDGLPKHTPKEILKARRKKEAPPRFATFRIDL